MPKLTKRIVEGIQPEDKDQYLWDSQLAGFGVRVSSLGRRSYIVQYRTKQGRQRKRTIGQHGKLTVEQARAMAQQIFAEVQQGGDPASQEDVQRAAPTVVELAGRYMDEYANLRKKPGSIRPDEYNLRCHVVPALGSKKVADVTRADIANLHYEMRDTPGAANRVLALLSKMFNLAEQWGYRPDASNPVRHVERYKEKKLERFLSSEEFARLGDVLAECERTQSEYPSVIAAIRLIIFTA